jgi:drug/metabolite transporter (DMT)-like permease
MSWVTFTLLAVFLWSLASIVDKYTISRYVKKPLVMLALYPFYSLIFALLIFFFHGITIPPSDVLILSLLAGILYFLMLFFYMKSLSFEEVSRVSSLFSLNLIFTLIFSMVFLGELFPSEKYLGILLVLLGSFLISTRKTTKIKISGALFFMTFASALGAVYCVMQKIILNQIDYPSAFVLVRLGSILLTPILFSQFIHLNKIIKKTPNVFVYLSFSEILNLFGVYLIVIAYSLGPVSLVSALSEIQPLVVLFMALLLGTFRPKILKEELKSSIISLKIISIFMIVAGAVLITL